MRVATSRQPMAVTRNKLEKILAGLKGRQAFSFAEGNRRGDQLDVFADVDDMASFYAPDLGDAPWFLAWTRADDAAAFGARGKLVQPLTMRWGGPGHLLQDKFARAGWIV